MDVKSLIEEKALMIEPILAEYVESDNDKISAMLSHTVKAGGKRIRPCLMLLACEAVGGDPNKILPAASSIELLHTFTLVHDDIIDNDLERRGRPTVHAKWGQDMGIIIGDTLYAKAFKALVDVRKNGISAEQVLDSLEVLNWANGEIHEGQILDMLFEERNDITIEDYMQMIRKKTAVLLSASLKIGAILADAGEAEINALSEFGDSIGLAFQIQDDLLDVIADEKELGKPVGSDIRKKKKSIIMVYALNNLKGDARKNLLGLLDAGAKDDTAVADAIKVLNESGSIDYAKNLVKDMADEGKKKLDMISESESKKALLDVADYIISRNY